ncbi:MAG: hypothetical protein DME62_08020 [Verrucomicrobia bacterium]|nr:MAG: hypothetical protein DME62_08020 [Verrucomicrobiota bacterium]
MTQSNHFIGEEDWRDFHDPISKRRAIHFNLIVVCERRLSQATLRPHYRISELNSPSLTRVPIFILGRTAVIVRIIFPRSFIVML